MIAVSDYSVAASLSLSLSLSLSVGSAVDNNRYQYKLLISTVCFHAQFTKNEGNCLRHSRILCSKPLRLVFKARLHVLLWCD